jgi:hypothetical protein
MALYTRIYPGTRFGPGNSDSENEGLQNEPNKALIPKGPNLKIGQ